MGIGLLEMVVLLQGVGGGFGEDGVGSDVVGGNDQ